jgi:hypothetical protein
MHSLMLAAVAALAVAGAASAMGVSHGGVHVPAHHHDRPLMLRHCTAGKHCGHTCIRATDVCHKK